MWRPRTAAQLLLLNRGGGYSYANAEAAALVARMSVEPDDTRKALIDDAYTTLKANGTLAKLDCLYFFPAHDQQAALLDWVDGSRSATLTNQPFFVADRGMWTDGSNDYIDTGFNPSLATNYQQNDASFGYWQRNGAQSATVPVGFATTTTNITLVSRNTSDNFIGYINATTSLTVGSQTTAYGLFAMNRAASGTVTAWKNGTQIGSGSSTSAARSNLNVMLGRRSSVYTEGQHLFFYAGASLSSQQHADLYSAISTLLTEIGVTEVVAATTATLSLVDQVVFPDGANADLAGRGYPSTGWDKSPDGTERWGGWGNVGNSANAGISLLSPPASGTDATTTLVEEFQTAALFATLPGYTSGTSGAAGTYPPASSTQGVWVDKEMSASDYDIYWVAVDVTNDINYLCRANWDGTDLTPISCAALPNGDINAAVRDKRGNWWVINNSTGSIIYCTNSDGVLAYDLTTMPATSTGVTNTDQLAYVAERDLLLLTYGANGSDGNVAVYDLSFGRPKLKATYTLTGALGIEGIVYDADNSVFEDTNDQYSHIEPGFPYNGLHLHGPVSL